MFRNCKNVYFLSILVFFFIPTSPSLGQSSDTVVTTPKQTLTAEQLSADIAALNKNKKLRIAVSAYLDSSLNAGDLSRFLPASTVKIITSAMALETLGPEFQFKTRIKWRRVDNATITQLKIFGSGDPTFGLSPFESSSSARFREFAKKLKAQGIRSIWGPIEAIPNERLELPPPESEAYTDIDEMACYGALANSFNYRGNCSNLVIAGKSKVYWEEPAIRAPIYNQLKWGDRTHVKIDVLLDKSGLRRGYRIYGTWKQACKELPQPEDPQKPNPPSEAEVKEPLPKAPAPCETIDAPDENALYYPTAVSHTKNWTLMKFVRELQRQGIQWKRTKKLEDINTFPKESDTLFSAPLTDLLTVQNKNSTNLISEALFKQIGLAYDFNDSPILSAQLALQKRFEQWGPTVGLPELNTHISIVDGSGISRYNQSTSEGLLGILRYILSQSYFSILRDTLAIYGEDGTLESRLPHLPPRYRIYAKTGTLNGHYNIAGFLPTASSNSGNPIHFVPFVIFTESLPSQDWRARRVQDQLVIKLLDSAQNSPP
ncbi:MAG: D-alanyl-D-alanine carboxypeptidase [Bdellovibrionales bacterium]|nr:D-alanyl-D-alanine carboxypeptidase [Bdellovibrionales bacterium]